MIKNKWNHSAPNTKKWGVKIFSSKIKVNQNTMYSTPKREGVLFFNSKCKILFQNVSNCFHTGVNFQLAMDIEIALLTINCTIWQNIVQKRQRLSRKILAGFSRIRLKKNYVYKKNAHMKFLPLQLIHCANITCSIWIGSCTTWLNFYPSS